MKKQKTVMWFLGKLAVILTGGYYALNGCFWMLDQKNSFLNTLGFFSFLAIVMGEYSLIFMLGHDLNKKLKEQSELEN